jgi:hypothetical protein
MAVRPSNAMLRRILAEAGSRDEYLRLFDVWLDEALTGQRPGRKSNEFDDLMLSGLAHMCRVAKDQRGISHHAMLKIFCRRLFVPDPKTGELHPHFGVTEEAAVKRLYRKLKARDFSDQEYVDYYARLGIDPDKVTLTLPGDPAYTVQGSAVMLDGEVVYEAGTNALAWAWIERQRKATHTRR